MATVIILATLGLIFGSFINALTDRIQAKKDWVKARSQCDRCNHTLAAMDLVPLFSWLGLKGKCRYCKKPISIQNPIVELSLAIVFIASYYFWPGSVIGSGQWLLFITWLLSAVGLMALLVYDLRFMLLPNKLIYPTLAVATSGRLVYLILYQPNRLHGLLMWLTSVAVASGVFLAIFVLSKGKWIGYGDVRLGLVTGTVLADPQLSFFMVFVASILGTIFVLPALLSGNKTLSAKVAYGPFLIIATFLVLLFGHSLVEQYKDLTL